jgi:hypothetical protein
MIYLRGKTMPENRHKTGFRGPRPEVGRATQFKPGESGNPGGRPKAILSDWLRREMEVLDPETQQEVAQKVARVLIQKALAGDIRAIQVLAERLEGKPQQPETKESVVKPMKVVVEYIGRP